MSTSEMYKYFKENKIEYNDIDPEMRELVYLINAKLNIKTKYCCIGEEDQNKTYILFDEIISDDQAIEFYVLMLDFQNYHRKMGIFYKYEMKKWLRLLREKNMMNWMLYLNTGKDLKFKTECVNNLCKFIQMKKGVK